MIRLFIQGIALGLLIAITMGPAFFAIIQTGINRGFKSGIFLALGILISDLTLIVLCYLGTSFIDRMTDQDMFNLYLGTIGGIILIIFGTVTFTRKPEILRRRSPNYQAKIKKPGLAAQMLKGYFMNIANPFLIFFWIGAMAIVKENSSEGDFMENAIIFFSGTLVTVFMTDVLKSFIGVKIKKFMKPRILLWVNRIVGIALGVFGLVLIFRSLFKFF